MVFFLNLQILLSFHHPILGECCCWSLRTFILEKKFGSNFTTFLNVISMNLTQFLYLQMMKFSSLIFLPHFALFLEGKMYSLVFTVVLSLTPFYKLC